VSAVVEADGLGKRYGHKWALSECTLAIPAGKVVGLVGPNGAGKTTLLHLSVGLLQPTAGSITVLGGRPGTTPDQLARVGFVAQDAPTYAGLSVRDHLRFGAWMNPGWDAGLAEDRIARLGLDSHRKAGELSGGQRAQLALTLAVAKRPELLMLDEPVASLDPLARREFLQGLKEVVAEHGASVILSSSMPVPRTATLPTQRPSNRRTLRVSKSSSLRISTPLSPTSRVAASGPSSAQRWGSSSRLRWRSAGSPTGGCDANTRDIGPVGARNPSVQVIPVAGSLRAGSTSHRSKLGETSLMVS